MTNVLVIGGAGYIGSSLALRLVRDGYNVTIFDSLVHNQSSVSKLEMMLEADYTLQEALLNDIVIHSAPRNFRFVHGDMRDDESMSKLFSEGRFDYVFHFGELVGANCCEANPVLANEVNYGGTRNVVDLVLKSDAALIYNSSSSLYGFRPEPKKLEESETLPPIEKMDSYCRNKFLSEAHIAKVKSRNPDFRYIVLRPATIGGLSPRMRLELLPQHFTYAALVGGGISLSEPDHYRAFIDIDDLVEGYIGILKFKEWSDGVFNIDGNDMTKRDYLDEVARAIKPQDFKIVLAEGISDVRNIRLSTRKFETQFGYKPAKTVRETVKPFADLLKERPDLFSRNGFQGVLNIPIDMWERLLAF